MKSPEDVFEVSKPLVPRMLRFLHVLLTECDARGCTMNWSENKEVGIRIEVKGLEYHLTVSEEIEKRDVLPASEELSKRKTYAWQRVQAETRMVPNGRLVVSLHRTRRNHHKWADRKRTSIEDKLPAILEEIDQQVAVERERQDAAERDRQEQQLKLEAAMERATSRFQEDRRIATLDAQLADWEKAAAIRAFCDASEGRPTPGKNAAETEAWLRWCRDYADRIDPVVQGVTAPPEPNPEDLRPYLPRHMKPYRPETSEGPPAAGRAAESRAEFPVPSQWHPHRRFWHGGAR